MIGRTLSRHPTLATFSDKYRASFGRKFRDAISKAGDYLKPLKKYVFKNFLMVHYFYIISITILASIILYPARNQRYIDILFIATGASTQGGLNTININDLELYQQIVIYIVTFLTTPIAIHGTLAFVRLYWFERHFDGIRDSSKRNYKMRRTKTLLQRELTNRTASGSRQRTGTRQFTSPSRHNDNFQEKLFSGKMLNRDEQDSLPGSAQEVDIGRGRHQNDPNSKSFAEPGRLSWSSSDTVEDPGEIHPSGRGLLFKEPRRRHHQHQERPPESFARRRGSADISPEDMYRSISMMKGQKQTSAENEGPALVIGAPAERFNAKNALNKTKQKLKGKDSSDSLTRNRTEKYPKELPDKDVEEGSEDRNGSDSNNNINYTTTTDNNNHNNHNKGNDGDDDDEHNDDQTDSMERRGGSDGSTSTSSSTTSDRNTPNSDDSSSSSSSRGNGSITSNDMTSDDRETMDTANSEPRSQSQPGRSQENQNGPSIHFDIEAPPKRKKFIDENGPMRKSRRRHYRQGIPMPSGKSISQRLKRSLSFGPMEKPRPRTTSTYEGAEGDTVRHLDDYFSDDREEKNSNLHSEDEITNRFPRANTFDDRRHSDEDDYAGTLGKSQSFDAGKGKDWNELSTSPEFQRMIYDKWKKEKKGRKSFLKPRIRTPSISTPNISGLRKFYTNSEEDENDRSDGDSSVDSFGRVHTDNDISDEESGDSAGNRDSLDEEEGYFGNGLSFADDPLHRKLSRSNSANYLSWEPTVGRNSIFVNMNKEQKEELGGVEYRATILLCRILVSYYGGFWILAFVFLLPWIVCRDGYRKIVREDGVAPAWWGFFTAMSAFADLGFTLTPDSMMSFQKTSYPTIIMMWFIVIGNTGFPVLLRFIIWLMFQLAPDLSLTRESLGFLLDHPRRCFTMLFPSGATWWLVITLIGLNAIDLIIFVILDLGSSFLHNMNRGYRVLAGLFQAICTRTAGFQIVNVGSLHPAVQISYMLMMYVSVMPMAISIRRTNVYEEQSLGVYGGPDSDSNETSDTDSNSDDEDSERTPTPPGPKKKPKSATSFIGAHLRRQLSFDLWFMFLGLFIICLAEGGKIRDTRRPEFNIFAILFEIVSAYGTVGLSLGYPNVDTAFSGQFGTISKLVIIALLIRGRHRGLPYNLDRAIMLPSDRLDNIDKLHDLQLRRRVPHDASADPVTAYFRSKIRALKNGFHNMSTKTTEEEHLLNEFVHSPLHMDTSNYPSNHHDNPDDNVIDVHDEPKEASSSLADSASQKQDPVGYFPGSTPSRSPSFERSPSDPLSGVPAPAQERPASNRSRSLHSYRMGHSDSTHSV